MTSYALQIFVFLLVAGLLICSIYFDVTNTVLVKSYMPSSPEGSSDTPEDQVSPFLEDISRQSFLRDDVTVVTAYLEIGSFVKGKTERPPDVYHSWMRVFSRVENPLVAYFDRTENAEIMRTARQSLPGNLTKIILVDRTDLWVFRILPQIESIYSQKDYPKIYPNTVYPEYASAVHSKYEFVQMAVRNNYFRTQYFAWLDIGLFRSEADSTGLPNFHIYLPPGFDPSRVAYGEVGKLKTGLDTLTIIRSRVTWLCGCFFLATGPVMDRWTWDYRAAVENMLQKNLMSFDQDVLYDMATNGNPNVQIQTYQRTQSHRWFFLGYLCREPVANTTSQVEYIR